MKRSFKKAEIEGEIYLYPVPVIKEQKYLILCDSSADAEKLINLIENNLITHPDEKDNSFFFVISQHTDGKTAILKFITN